MDLHAVQNWPRAAVWLCIGVHVVWGVRRLQRKWTLDKDAVNKPRLLLHSQIPTRLQKKYIFFFVFHYDGEERRLRCYGDFYTNPACQPLPWKQKARVWPLLKAPLFLMLIHAQLMLFYKRTWSPAFILFFLRSLAHTQHSNLRQFSPRKKKTFPIRTLWLNGVTFSSTPSVYTTINLHLRKTEPAGHFVLHNIGN